MNHEVFRESLALRRYGELPAAEEERLARHLAGCEACRAFAAELGATFDALDALETRAADELPDGWAARVRSAAAAEPRRGLSLASFVLGLAAGLALMALVTRTERGERPESGGETTIASNAGSSPAFVALAAPPPRTTSRDPLAQLAALKHR